ncbi:type VI secretion system baseplate subunit TssK [Pseudomonas sp. JZ134]|uniref:type VI secretion system baseplate subunit TssK n=1 Tax=Pseudomonas sp. JZ134 TaxID=2806615 RepID=UPI003D9FB736
MHQIPDAVCWHEGMHLLPQHFQLQSLRAESLSARLSQGANPWYWGVETLTIDPSSLLIGLVRLTELSAILPDGLPVRLDPAADAPLELNISTTLKESSQKYVTVYLAVAPLWRAGRLVPLSGRLRSVNTEAIPDLASGDFPESVAAWRPEMRLVTSEGRADSVCIPLLRVGREAGAFLQVSYLPPSPRILPESALGKRIVMLCSHIREKCQFLTGRLRQAQHAAHRDDIYELKTQLGALLSGLPALEVLISCRVAHPLQVHFQLTTMAGSFAALDPLSGIPYFKPLDYEDLLSGFDEVLLWLEKTLTLIRGGYRSLPFVRGEQYFSIGLPDDQKTEQTLVIGLRMPAGATPQSAREWLEGIIIASQPHLPVLSRQRMRGLSFQPLGRKEQIAYSVGEETRLFQIQAHGEWFQPDKPLCLTTTTGETVEPWEVVLFVALNLD